MTSRQELRQQLRQFRRSIPPVLRAQLSLLICQQVRHTRQYQRAQHVAFYLANDAEVDVSFLIRDAWQRGKQVYIPVLGLRHTGRLWFVPFNPGDELQWNRFGIAEPRHAKHHRSLPLRRLDLVILPLVGFDSAGHRLGMGGGFYDRSLAHRARSSRQWPRPFCMGVAYQIQQVEHIESHPWDVPLDSIVSEDGIHYFK